MIILMSQVSVLSPKGTFHVEIKIEQSTNSVKYIIIINIYDL